MDLRQFRKEIIISTVCMAALTELISLIVIGPDKLFAAGLAAGTLATIGCFLILVRTGSLLDVLKSGTPVVVGYFVRMLLYGAAFLVCIRVSLACGLGCLAGFICLHAGIFALYGFVYRFIKKKENPLNDWTEPKEWNDLSVYDEEDEWDRWPEPETKVQPDAKAGEAEDIQAPEEASAAGNDRIE